MWRPAECLPIRDSYWTKEVAPRYHEAFVMPKPFDLAALRRSLVDTLGRDPRP
jgi:hypothetical protein